MNRLHRAGLRRVRWMVPFTVLVLTAFFAGCESDDPVDPPSTPSLEAPQVDTVNVPPFWVYNSPDYRTISVKLSMTPALEAAVKQQDVVAPQVFMILRSPDGMFSSSVQLWDDGGGRTLENQLDFVADHSGDLAPFDLTYSLRINAGFALSQGDILMEIMAGWVLDSDPTTMTTLPAETLQVEVNTPPVIEAFVHSDSLRAGFEAEQWTATVNDADIPGGDAVQIVEMHLQFGETGRDRLMAQASPRVWTFSLDSTFAAGLPTAEYTLTLTAIDRFNQEAVPYEGVIWIENTAPMLSNLVAPDTVYRPEGDQPNPYNMFINVADLQGPGDITRVDYIPVDPNGNIPDDLSPFFFNDLGDTPDEVAHDGIWSHQFAVYPNASNFGTYTFTITAHDRVGNNSESIVHMVELPSSGGKR